MTEFHDLMCRARSVLAELSVMSEAPAGRALDAAPLVTNGNRDKGGRPAGSSESLYDIHRRSIFGWIYGDGAHLKPRDLDELRSRVADAELARDHARWRAPLRTDALGRPETTEERNARILTEYDGVHYAEAAARESVSRTHMRRLRTNDKRDALYGRAPVPA